MYKKIFLFPILFIIIFSENILFSQWQELNTGIIYTLFSISAPNDDIVWACASGNYILRTTDGGQTFTNVGVNVPAPYGVETCIYAFDANTAIFTCYAGNPNNAYVYKTTNAGGNWSLVFTQFPGFITCINFKDQTHGFMVGWPQGGRWSLWRTSNAGNSWDSTGLYIPESNGNFWSFENAMVYSGTNIWFGARGKGIFYSTNDGTNWTLQDLTTGGFPYPSAIFFETPQLGYSSAQLNLIKTTNHGINWVVLPGTTSAEFITRGVFSRNNEIWFVRDLEPNIYYSSNGGTNWITQHTAPSGNGYKHLVRSRDGINLWACTISGEMAKYTLTVGIEKQSSEVPKTFVLYQNYPNPFNPTTKIKFSIPQLPVGQTFLSVYDILGRKVAILVNEKLQPGTYEVEWDGSNFASGVYFYTLKTENYSETKKMILIK